MANKQHADWLINGAFRDLTRWKNDNPDKLLDFSRAVFKNIEWEKSYDLRNSDFQGATFDSVKLSNFNFSGVSFYGDRFDKCEFRGCDFTGCSFKNCVFNACGFYDSILKEADFTGVKIDNFTTHGDCISTKWIDADITSLNLNNADAESAQIFNSTMQNCQFTNTKLSNSKMENVKFNQGVFTNADLSESTLKKVMFKGADLTNLFMTNSKLTDVEFESVNLTKARLDWIAAEKTSFVKNCEMVNIDLTSSRFIDSAIRNCDAQNADLNGVKLSGCDLWGTNFSGSNLFEADLTRVNVSTQTRFENVTNAIACRMDKVTLELLGSDQGGLTPGHRRTMKIRDDVVELRRDFSGYRRSLHAISVLIFVAPYLWFLIKQCLRIRYFSIDPETESVPLLILLYRYVVSHGQGDSWHLQTDHNAIYVFLFITALFYIGLRSILWVKTLNLEHEQNVTELTVEFSMNDPISGKKCLKRITWNDLRKAQRRMFKFVYLPIIIVNTIIFLWQRVPLP